MSDPSPFDRNSAAREFITALIQECHLGAPKTVTSILRDGPPGRHPDSELVSLHNWFQQLNDEDRERVSSLMRNVANYYTFELLVLFDGMAWSGVFGGKPFDFTLNLQTYADRDAWWEDRPETIVRINPPNNEGIELHGMLDDFVDKNGNLL